MSSSPRPSPLHCPSLPPSFCHLCPSICSSSIPPFIHPSIHPSTQPCGAFYPALSGFFIPPSLHPHISQSAALFQPLIAPSRPPAPLVHMYFYLFSAGATVHCQTTEDTVVTPFCHCLCVHSLNLFLTLTLPSDGSFSASSHLWPLMSPCAHLSPCHYA